VTGTENPSSSSASRPRGPFRLAYVPGVTPGKWAKVWGERVRDVPLELAAVSAAEAEAALREGTADASLLRLPIDRSGLSAIPLYAETSVVVIPKDHEVAAVEEASVADLADYVVLHPLDDCLEWENVPGQPAVERPATTQDAIDLVAAGAGLLVVPQSLARLHHRRDLTYRTISDAPQSRVALSWLEEQTTELMEELIGIVRGRTANSSRGRGAAQAPEAKKAAKPAKPAKGAKAAKPARQQKQQKPRGQARRGNR
jgi:DNA-binding transcriptional LysR family regulator